MADAARPDRTNKQAIAERQRQVSGLYLARRTQTEIARALQVSQATVSGDLAALRSEWRKEAITDIEAALLRETAELDTVEAQAAAQFASTKEMPWLMVRLRCKAQRAQLLGLNKHRMEISGPGGQPIQFTEVLIELPHYTEAVETSAPVLLNTVPAAGSPAPNGNGFRELVVEMPG